MPFPPAVRISTAFVVDFRKIAINRRKIIRTHTVYPRFRIELNFPVTWLNSEFDKFKGVKTGRDQTCTLLRKIGIGVLRIISSVLGFELCTYAL